MYFIKKKQKKKTKKNMNDKMINVNFITIKVNKCFLSENTNIFTRFLKISESTIDWPWTSYSQ